MSDYRERTNEAKAMRAGIVDQRPQPNRIWPTIPIVPNTPGIGANPRCGECGIELSPVMGYVCSRGGKCPTGLGGFSCTVAA